MGVGSAGGRVSDGDKAMYDLEQGHIFLPVILNREHGERNWKLIQETLRIVMAKPGVSRGVLCL